MRSRWRPPCDRFGSHESFCCEESVLRDARKKRGATVGTRPHQAISTTCSSLGPSSEPSATLHVFTVETTVRQISADRQHRKREAASSGYPAQSLHSERDDVRPVVLVNTSVGNRAKFRTTMCLFTSRNLALQQSEVLPLRDRSFIPHSSTKLLSWLPLIAFPSTDFVAAPPSTRTYGFCPVQWVPATHCNTHRSIKNRSSWAGNPASR